MLLGRELRLQGELLARWNLISTKPSIASRRAVDIDDGPNLPRMNGLVPLAGAW